MACAVRPWQENIADVHHEVQVSTYHLFRCLGEAMDLVHPQLVDHHKRTALVAASIAEELGLSSQEQKTVVLASLVHDAGAFSLREKLDVARFDSEAVMSHCMAGYLLLRGCPSLGKIARIVRYHHVRWEEADETAAPKASHILHLADRVAASLTQGSEPLTCGRAIVKQIRNESGKMFDPEIVEVFEQVASREAFWFDATSRKLDETLDRAWRNCEADCDMIDLYDIGELFGRIIDFRSRFTATHSRGVAAIAERIGQLMGLNGASRMLRAAGYLHDIGKLSVPTEILESDQALTSDELNRVRIHPYHTFQILSTVEDLSEINMWASYHHECLDGSGYPFRLGADRLSLEARILAVADVFVALSEDRPYRPAMSATGVIRIMKQFVRDSKLDRNVVALLATNYDDVNESRRMAQSAIEAEYQVFAASALFPAFEESADVSRAIMRK